MFTHITDQWSAWLLEMHRVLKPDGLMIATFLGRGTSMHLVGEPWEARRIGMNALGFTGGAPFVLHSNWWLRAHWGRAFEFVSLRPDGFALDAPKPAGHGWAMLRPKPDPPPTIQELERDEPGEGRYLEARRHHLQQLAAEGERVRNEHRVRIEAAHASAPNAPEEATPAEAKADPGPARPQAWLTRSSSTTRAATAAP